MSAEQRDDVRRAQPQDRKQALRLPIKGRPVAKLPEELVDEFAAGGKAEHFDSGMETDAWPRLREASPLDVLAALAVLAAYYLLFVFGWQ